MKSHFYPGFLALCIVLSGWFHPALNASEVTKDRALAIAERVVKEYFPASHHLQSARIGISGSIRPDYPFFVCAIGEAGFVLVAKTENCPPVLGFSWESKFPALGSEMPPLMNTVIENIRGQCDDFARRETISPNIIQSWESLLEKKSASAPKTGVIPPLLTTSWNCDSTFFDLYPGDFKAGGSVPIAMSQVFRFYAFPFNGSGNLCYPLTGYGDFCTSFSQTKFRFDRMSDTNGNPAVDSLIYYMAAACKMQPNGAALNTYVSTLPVHFGYSTDMRVVEGWNYNIGDVVRHQLSMGHPVPADWIGHSFVIDGYFPDNLFHFNMGMGGQYNGFYLLDYPVVKVDADHSLLNCYTDFHPRSEFPAPTDLTAAAEGDSIRISWNANLIDSLHSRVVRFVVLRDGLISVAETTASSVLVSLAMMGGSSRLRVVTDFGTYGASEMSDPYLFISNLEVANIPSLALRQSINTILGNTDLHRQPFVGELELIRDIEISFADQRGLEKLPELKSLRIDGKEIRLLRDGDYLQRLINLRFYNCIDFDFNVLRNTRSILQLFGYDYLPLDLYDLRHNSDLGLIQLLSSGKNPNMLMDLYGADKYFPKLADFYLFHVSAGASANYEDCFVSYESYLDIYPGIKANLNLFKRTKPSSFAPCYPTPARNTNVPSVSRLSWQANFGEAPDVYYNVFLGNSRGTLELVSAFQTDKYYEGTFEPDRDYYWRIEVYHADSTYYSGINHFSTWQDLPIPFIEKFDDYYADCEVVRESPFWRNFDHAFTGKAATDRNVKFDGLYALRLNPQSDAGVLINSPADRAYYIEFRVLNKGGQITTELLQKSGSSDDHVVNSKIDFQGADIGLLTFGESSFPFHVIPDQWNRINISLNMNTGVALLSVNEVALKEWQWPVQMGGTANSNPFAGISFRNHAVTGGGSGYIDNLIIDRQNPLSSALLHDPSVGLTYLPVSREIMLSGIQPAEVSDITLYDLQGRKLVFLTNPQNLIVSVGPGLRNGIYLVVVNRRDGMPFSRKIAVLD